jgi:hypothetical protein
MPALSADAAFANAANAAASAFASNPPYVAYHLNLRTSDGSTEKDHTAQITLRTGDGIAFVEDDSGTHRLAAPPALPPTVDALANWAFALDSTSEYPTMSVTYEEPRRYDFATPGPATDVVVPGINGFSVRYADGEPTHLQLQPATAAVKTLATERDRFLYRDVWFDQSTWLPTRVVVIAVNATLTLDYAIASGHWLLSHLDYEAANEVRGSTAPASIQATYSSYAFPATGPDVR